MNHMVDRYIGDQPTRGPVDSPDGVADGRPDLIFPLSPYPEPEPEPLEPEPDPEPEPEPESEPEPEPLSSDRKPVTGNDGVNIIAGEQLGIDGITRIIEEDPDRFVTVHWWGENSSTVKVTEVLGPGGDSDLVAKLKGRTSHWMENDATYPIDRDTGIQKVPPDASIRHDF
jgi:hypothetical protein